MDEDIFIERAHFAKVDIGRVRKPSAAISFSAEIENCDLKLIELTPALVRQIENGEELVIRGDDSDSVVICNETETYDIKMCTTSNILLATPNLEVPKDSCSNAPIVSPCEIVMRATDYLEPKLIRAKSEKFSFSIPRFVLKDVHSGKISEPEGISTEDLMNSIQASEAQITEMLKMSGAIDRMGWKIFTDIDSLCVDISKALDSESSNLEEVNLQELIDTINYVEEVWPVWAIKHALFCIGSPNEDGETFSLDAKKLSVQVGHWLLLQSDNRKVELDAFMDWWSTILPDETPHSLADLFHFCYISEESRGIKAGKNLVYFDPLSLPSEALKLFDHLFQLKRKWSEQELMTIVDTVTPPGKKTSQVIQKYCRVTKTASGEKEYTIHLIK